PDGDPGEPLLADRGVAHPARPELSEQPGGDLVRALEHADLLADQEHVLVPLQLGAERVVQGLPVAHHRHAGPPPVTGSPGRPRYMLAAGVAYTWSKRAVTSGGGLASAKSTAAA